VSSNKILTLTGGSVAAVFLLASFLPATSGASSYPPPTIAPTTTTTTPPTTTTTTPPTTTTTAAPPTTTTVPSGKPEVKPGNAVVTNPNGTTTVAKIAATSGSSVGIKAGSLGLSLGSTYSTSVTYSPSTKTVTLSNGVTVNLHGLGLKPGTVVQIVLYSSGTVVGQGIVAADGTYSIAVVIPPGISQGNHTISESATSKSGKHVSLSMGIKIAAPKNVTVGPFTSGAQLSSKLATEVHQLAVVIKAQHKKHVVLTGYTDATGGHAANITESQRRASSVRAQLSADLKALHVRGVSIASRGVGPAHPVASSRTKAGQIKDRRVVATLS